MNLSILERLAQEGDLSINALRYLLDCKAECEWLDYKEMLNLENDRDLCDFTRDVLAIQNVGGGYIVVGVKDKTWQPVGISTLLPYDTKKLRDKIRRGAGVDLSIDIVHHDTQISSSNLKFALILIRASKKRKKRRSPTLAKKDCCANKNYGIRRGEIYIRDGDTTVKIDSQEQLERLLADLEYQVDQDAIQADEQRSPFAVEDGPYRLLEKGYGQFIGRKNLRRKIMSAVTKDPRIWIINVHGPGGVGKSALVNWTVYEFYRLRTFESILHLTAKETELTNTGIGQYYGRNLYSLDNLLDQILNVYDEPIPSEMERKVALGIDILSSWSTLLVLDNMESVDDARVLKFIQDLPQGIQTKVLITSRKKTGAWENPIAVTELKEDEVAEFLEIKLRELNMKLSLQKRVIRPIAKSTGGLPLAIQWFIGQYRKTGNVQKVLTALAKRDSPILEFSFRNIWKLLSSDAKAVLAILTIFKNPPTMQMLSIATDWPIERIEETLSELQDVTLVTRNIQHSDGRETFIALPITLMFAHHQLDEIGDFGKLARQRYQKFSEQMELREKEVSHFVSIFERFGIDTDNEKRAVILCRRGESEMFAGNISQAKLLFQQARELAPQNAYVNAMSASFELARGKAELALEYVDEAIRRADKRAVALCYTIKARILHKNRDRAGEMNALQKALQYDPANLITRHHYGVALSRAGREKAAIDQFTLIIEAEKKKSSPSDSLFIALKTRIINLLRLNLQDEAKKDLDFAIDLISKNPHKRSYYSQFDEFRI